MWVSWLEIQVKAKEWDKYNKSSLRGYFNQPFRTNIVKASVSAATLEDQYTVYLLSDFLHVHLELAALKVLHVHLAVSLKALLVNLGLFTKFVNWPLVKCLTSGQMPQGKVSLAPAPQLEMTTGPMVYQWSNASWGGAAPAP
jgi:hypothetical protein